MNVFAKVYPLYSSFLEFSSFCGTHLLSDDSDSPRNFRNTRKLENHFYLSILEKREKKTRKFFGRKKIGAMVGSDSDYAMRKICL